MERDQTVRWDMDISFFIKNVIKLAFLYTAMFSFPKSTECERKCRKMHNKNSCFWLEILCLFALSWIHFGKVDMSSVAL